LGFEFHQHEAKPSTVFGRQASWLSSARAIGECVGDTQGHVWRQSGDVSAGVRESIWKLLFENSRSRIA
jgi:hypothetical protein